MTSSDELRMQKVGGRIRALRIQRKMTQANLADAVHLSLPQIVKIEHGRTDVRLSSFARIAEILQVSADDLLRLDVPGTKWTDDEVEEVFSGCSPAEIDAMLTVAKEVKSVLHSKEYNQD